MSEFYTSSTTFFCTFVELYLLTEKDVYIICRKKGNYKRECLICYIIFWFLKSKYICKYTLKKHLQGYKPTR